MKSTVPQRSDDLPVVGRVSALGAGGICILHIAGRQAQKLIQPFLEIPSGRRLSELEDGDIVYGLFYDHTGVIDEVLVVRRSEDFWEINCHGGAAAISAIEDRLTSAGATVGREKVLDGGELSGLDSVRRAAYRELAYTKTRRAARMLADQLEGALPLALNMIKNQKKENTADEQLQALLQTYYYGRALVEPKSVQIVGVPNVGKSTLLNRILGYDRAITSPVPGTTVDRIGDLREIDGYPLLFSDSAGLVDGGRPDEVGSKNPEFALVVLDASRRLEDGEIEIADRFPPDSRLIVLNKCDLTVRCDFEKRLENGENPIMISALYGSGMDDLLEAIRAMVTPAFIPEPGSAVIFRDSWYRALLEAGDDEERIRAAAQRILEGNLK